MKDNLVLANLRASEPEENKCPLKEDQIGQMKEKGLPQNKMKNSVGLAEILLDCQFLYSEDVNLWKESENK